MILQALNRLAETEGLMDDSDFEPRPVAWLVNLSQEGRFLGFTSTHAPPTGNSKKKGKAKVLRVPREKARTSGDYAFFLVDKAEYSFGVDPEGKRDLEKLGIRAGLFREKIQECLDETSDPGVAAVLAFLSDVAQGRQDVPLPEDCLANELFSFIWEPDVDLPVHLRPRVKEFWKNSRNSPPAPGLLSMRCLVTGKPMAEAGLFPPLKKVPGGSSSGISLVSYNAPAFLSYGLKSNENAPISREAAEACSTALNRLLDPAWPDPHQPGLSLPKRNLTLSSDTVAVFWTASEAGAPLVDILADLLDPNPDRVAETFRSIWTGRSPSDLDEDAFFALVLSGAQGRATVRDWFESTVREVAANLAAHFEDVNIVRNTPPPQGKELSPRLALGLLIQSLAPFGSREEVPSHLAARMVRAALSGAPYPLAALQRALMRYRMELPREQDSKDWWKTKNLNDARAAIIKAVINRRRRMSGGNSPFQEVKPAMDKENKNNGYLLGRLMAVIERMQQVSLGDVNASVVDRYFSSASATPRAVFPRLLKNMRHHARKAKDEPKSAGTAGWLENQADEIMDGITGFPGFLDLESQGLFVLAYHQQRKFLWTKKEDRETAPKA
ncbi:MAG: type I-C CRISPR-associated protein Cas8c/Csd1 [Proteobacteria bacterium]|nr:type I-C CRISPR-associated protein Cas8c/Csd1 [Pseudomonadota bacterium]